MTAFELSAVKFIEKLQQHKGKYTKAEVKYAFH